ncbi:MAG: Dabb family protein [Planctomycetota bacterium]
MLAHSVYFTLKDRTPSAALKLVAGCRQHLTGHSGTKAFAVGTCADYDRQVNDRDYDVALMIVFDSHASHDAYQSAERHNCFIAEHADSWAKVRIFDADLATLET